MKKKNFLIIIPCVLVGFFGSQYKTEASDEQKYKNLEKLCLVWGYTKYRHPVFLSAVHTQIPLPPVVCYRYAHQYQTENS